MEKKKPPVITSNPGTLTLRESRPIHLRQRRRHWVVTAVTGPGPAAKHRRYRFTPDYEYHEREAVAHFQKQNGTEYYLGDWHTHPSGSPESSWLDRTTLHKNAARASHTDFRSLMLIIGGELDTPDFSGYIGFRTSGWGGNLKKPLGINLIFFARMD